MKYQSVNALCIGVLGIGFMVNVHAEDLQYTYQQYLNLTDAQMQAMIHQHYQHLIIEFEKGDKFPVSLGGNLFEFTGTTAELPYIVVKNNFWLKLPWGEGDIYISGDGKHYTKLEQSFSIQALPFAFTVSDNASRFQSGWAVFADARFYPPTPHNATPVNAKN